MQTSKKIRIAVDAMGGDYAPEEVVKGSIHAVRELGVEIILVGAKMKIEQELKKLDTAGLPVSIVDAPDVIANEEQPAYAVFRKPNSSVVIATRLVKEGKADAAMSAGSTGACMVSALQYLGALPGIERPIAGGAFLQIAPKTVVMDLGANVGSQPHHLVNYAVAGIAFSKCFLGVTDPTVALLNVGAEEGKGDDLAKEAYKLLKNSGMNFIGNVEGMDIPLGKANVVVCDGFVGNVMVKLCEGLGQMLSRWLGKELKDKVAPDILEDVSRKLYRTISPALVMGGGPLLGVNGVFAKAHGSSKAVQVVGTLKTVKQAVESGFVNIFREELEKVQKKSSN